MKTAEAKPAAMQAAKTSKPFFNKAGDGMFSREIDNDHSSFFSPLKNFFFTANGANIQTKLTIGEPGDKYEQEADAMADKVVQRLNDNTSKVTNKNENAVQTKPIAQVNSIISPLHGGFYRGVQTKCAACEGEEELQKKEEDEKDLLKGKLQKKPIFESNAKPPDDEKNIQRKCAECEKEDKLQKKSDTSSSQTASPNIESSLNSSKGSGSPLPENTRTQMESSFGADFSSVRIHNDSSSVQMSKDLNAQAFTHGSDIYFNAGKYDANNPGGKHLLAHELTHTIQQDQVMVQKKENENQATHANPPGIPSLAQIKSPLTTVAGVKDLPPRNEIELIGLRLKARQADFADFLNIIRTDINNIRIYFKWVSSVYDRTYGHYVLVLKQANAKADTEQLVLDAIVGLATGIAVSFFGEITLGLLVTKTLAETMIKFGGEFLEAGIGLGVGATGTKPEIAKATISEELNPAFKKLQALENLDKLNSTALDLAIPGPIIYTGPITEVERLSAELRVAEAKGKRKLSDDDIRQSYLKLMKFDLQSLLMETDLKEKRINFDKLRVMYMGKQAPSDQRCEQDIWIQWLAKQNPQGSWGGMFGSIVVNKIIVNHLVDLGLTGRGKKGGRLKADIEYHNPTLEPGHDNDDSTAQQVVNGAKAEVVGLPAYWNDVFLMGTGGKK